MPVRARLSLSSVDSDPSLLASGIVEALQALSPARTHASGTFLGIDPEGDVKAMYRQLCRAAQDLEAEVDPVIDDAQRAGEGLGTGLLGLLLESRPDQLRLVLVGTSFLELVMSRLLLTDPGALMPGEELAFDVEELSRLCAHLGSELGIEALMEDCQGWPIAARMAILVGQRPASADQDAHTRLGDYVRDHVLAALPGHLASFILTATSCAELTPDLAAAVSGRDDAGALLEDLTRRGIFLHRFDLDGQVAYRWHPVFARQCGRILSAGQGAQWREAHARAARFLEAADPLASMAHLVDAGAVERAVDTLTRHWVGLLVDGQAAAVAQWCAGLPDGVAEDPRVLLVWACAEDILGEHRVARTRFSRATRLVARGVPDGGTQTVLRSCNSPSRRTGHPGCPREKEVREHERVGVDHPLQLAERRRRGLLQVRQRDVEDRVVDDDHEQAEAQHAEHPPAQPVRARGPVEREERAANGGGSHEGLERYRDGKFPIPISPRRCDICPSRC